MRCKPGEMVIVVGGKKQWIGRILTTTELCFEFKDAWFTEPEVWNPVTGRVVLFRDKTLHPIRPDADPVETEREIEVTA